MYNRRASQNRIQEASRDIDQLLVALSSAHISSSPTLTDNQEDDVEELVDPCEDVVEEIPIAVRRRQSSFPDPSQILRRRQGEATVTVGGPAATQNSLETSIIDLCDETILTTNDETVFFNVSQEGLNVEGEATPTVGGQAATQNPLETSIIDLCNETTLTTNDDETVFLDVSQEEQKENQNLEALVPVPEETIMVDDDEDEDEDEDESRQPQEVVDMFDAEVRANNTSGVPGADTTIELSESEEEVDKNEEAGSLNTTLNILTISCPVCLAGFREIQADGGRLCSTICGHIFCKSCLDGCGASGYFKCPSCRKTLSSRDYHPIFLS